MDIDTIKVLKFQIQKNYFKIFKKINKQELSLEELANMLTTRKHIAKIVKKFVSYLPQIEVTYTLKPIAQTVLKMDVSILVKKINFKNQKF